MNCKEYEDHCSDFEGGSDCCYCGLEYWDWLVEYKKNNKEEK